jgi:DNA-binding MarR family transcriptional regulator
MKSRHSPAPTHRFAYLLTVAHKRMQNWIAAQSDGATAARSGVLMILREGDVGAPLSEVGRALDMSPSALSGLIDRMEAADLVRRQVDAKDARAIRLHLTSRGQDARAAAVAQARSLNSRLTADFSDEELAIVARWLTTFRDKFPKDSSE